MVDQATLLAIRRSDYWPGWATSIDEALSGDGSSLWSAGEHIYLDLDTQVYYRSLCADFIHPAAAGDFGKEEDSLVFAYASELAPCVNFPRGVQPESLAADDEPRPDVQIYVSTRDPLAPADTTRNAAFLSSLGRFCVSDLPSHTSYADDAGRASMLSFLETGQPAC
jgi:hypothetical protein